MKRTSILMCSGCLESLQHEEENGYSLTEYPEVWEHIYQRECPCCGPTEAYDTVRTNMGRYGPLNFKHKENLHCEWDTWFCHICEHSLPSYRVQLRNNNARGKAIINRVRAGDKPALAHNNKGNKVKKEKESVKRLNVIMEKGFHREFKKYAVKCDTTMSTIIKALVVEEMNANRKYDEQHYAQILETEMAGR